MGKRSFVAIIVFFSLIFIMACDSGGGSNDPLTLPPAGDTDLPWITAYSPEIPGNIDINTEISIEFNEEIDCSTVTQYSFYGRQFLADQPGSGEVLFV